MVHTVADGWFAACTTRDVAEGLADLCGDVVRAYDDMVQFGKYVSTQILILSGTIIGAANKTNNGQVRAGHTWFSLLHEFSCSLPFRLC